MREDGVLTPAIVRDIHARWWQTEITRLSRTAFTRLEGARLKVSPSVIRDLLSGETWRQVPWTHLN